MATFSHLLKDLHDKEDVTVVAQASGDIQSRLGDFSTGETYKAEPVIIEDQLDYTKELQMIWRQWSDKRKCIYMQKFGDLLHVTDLLADNAMLGALIYFWEPRRRCFDFNGVDLVPTIEEYRRLLDIPVENERNVYLPEPRITCRRAFSNLMKKPVWESPATESYGGREYIPWANVKKEMQTAKEEEMHKLLTLAIYGLIIFPRIPAHIDEAIVDLVRQILSGCDPTSAILAETIRSLTHLRITGSGQFRGCLPLLCTWLQGHFPCTVPRFHAVYREPPTVLLDILLSKWELPKGFDDWMKTLESITEDNVIWTAPWMPVVSLTYSCGDYNWVPLLGPWGGTAYAPLQGGRQVGRNQIIPVLFGMEDCDFTYDKAMLEEKGKKMYQAWSTPHKIKPNSPKSGVHPAYIPWRAQHKPQLTTDMRAVLQDNQNLRQQIQRLEVALEGALQRLQLREKQIETILKQREEAGERPPQRRRRRTT